MARLFVPRSRIDDAAGAFTASIRWMRTEQAAVMRSMPEQMTATNWWAANHNGDYEDTATTVPAWIHHYYGVSTPPDHAHTTTGAVHHLLITRAAAVQNVPLCLVDDPQLRMVLVSMAHTPTYHAAQQNTPESAAGTVLFTEPIPFTQSTDTPSGFDAALSAQPASSLAQLRGVTWMVDSAAMRTMDWITTKIDPSGNDYIDTQVASAVGSKSAPLPPMITNGEWARHTTAVGGVHDCRSRITAAAASIRAGETALWDGSAVGDDDALFAARLAEVCADAITAGFVTTVDRRTSRRLRRPLHRSVTVLTAA